MATNQPTSRKMPIISAKVHMVPDNDDAEGWLYAYKVRPDKPGKTKWRKYGATEHLDELNRPRYAIQVKTGRKIYYCDVPKAFFNDDGEFIAKPEYKNQETLKVQFTGYGKNWGFIDTNIAGRGRGGGGTGGDGTCAKWS
ncbi:MAG TPA: hypothetical protein EYG21_02155 [Nitrospinaceae bacterium]|nr:hypothetical protein [Nitrospinaceae bacterium]